MWKHLKIKTKNKKEFCKSTVKPEKDCLGSRSKHRRSRRQCLQSCIWCGDTGLHVGAEVMAALDWLPAPKRNEPQEFPVSAAHFGQRPLPGPLGPKAARERVHSFKGKVQLLGEHSSPHFSLYTHLSYLIVAFRVDRVRCSHALSYRVLAQVGGECKWHGDNDGDWRRLTFHLRNVPFSQWLLCPARKKNKTLCTGWFSLYPTLYNFFLLPKWGHTGSNPLFRTSKQGKCRQSSVKRTHVSTGCLWTVLTERMPVICV